MDTEMTCYESFAEVTEDFYCSAVDVLRILVLRLHDYHARCFHSLRDALYDYFSTDAAPHTHANVSTKHTVTACCAPPSSLREFFSQFSQCRRFAMNYIYLFIIF
mgnify:CR=1 FL=1